MFAALMVAMARALSLIPRHPHRPHQDDLGLSGPGAVRPGLRAGDGTGVRLVEDILGFILQPTGDFFPGYTLSTMAGVLVYALCFYRARITVLRIVLANLVVNLLVNA